jgi:plastocyanin
MTRSRPRHALLASLVVSAFALAACGGGDGYGGGGDDGGGNDDPYTVTVGPGGGTSFSPATLTVPVGTTVTFRFSSGGHNVVSGDACTADGVFCSSDDTGCDSAPTNASGTTYMHTFTEAGTFPYFCAPHCVQGMTGTIVVQ